MAYGIMGPSILTFIMSPEIHFPKSIQNPPCDAISGASDISTGSNPEGLPSPVPDPALFTEVTLGVRG